MKYNQLPQTQQINVIIPNQQGLQVPGGNTQAFTADTATVAPDYGVPIGAQPHTLPAQAGQGMVVTATTQGQTASGGLVRIRQSGIPAGNIRVLLSTLATFGANIHGDVGRSPTPAFTGNDLPLKIATAIAAAGGRFGVTNQPITTGVRFRLNQLRQVLAVRLNTAHSHARDQAVFNALNVYFQNVQNYPQGAFDLYLVQELERQIWGAHAQQVTHLNAGQRIQNTLRAIAVGVRQLG